jgi:DNA-binding CsgD family transcriptional regulator
MRLEGSPPGPARGDWEAVRARCEADVAREPTADRLDALAEALYWLDEADEARTARQRAYAAYVAAGRTVEAARAAMWLANEHLLAQGSRSAWNGWLTRAEHLLEGVGPCAEHGWLLFQRGRRADTPEQVAEACRAAIAIARERGDRDLEVVASSQLGRALVSLGRADEGFVLLDEAMALATGGEVRSFSAISDTCCNMLVTCEHAAELERLSEWCRVTADVSREWSSRVVFAFCRLNHASALIALGRWREADEALEAARAIQRQMYPAYAIHSTLRVAELRVAQGRLEDAAELLAEHEANPLAARALARLHLARGDGASAVAVLERRVEGVADTLELVPLLLLQVEAFLRAGEPGKARGALGRLLECTSRAHHAVFDACVRLARGEVALASGEDEGLQHLEAALERFTALDMPFDAARARLAIAAALSARRPDAARLAARAARDAFAKLGAGGEADRAAELLRTLGGGVSGPRGAGVLSKRESEVLALLSKGLSNEQIGKRLFISPRTVEHHVGHILAKLELPNRIAAAAHSRKHGLPE